MAKESLQSAKEFARELPETHEEFQLYWYNVRVQFTAEQMFARERGDTETEETFRKAWDIAEDISNVAEEIHKILSALERSDGTISGQNGVTKLLETSVASFHTRLSRIGLTYKSIKKKAFREVVQKNIAILDHMKELEPLLGLSSLESSPEQKHAG